MATWTPLKRDVLDALADEFLHNYGKGRTILAVDGAGATHTAEQFADDLAERLGRGGHSVFRASLGDFLLPATQRAATGKDLDESLFRRVLVEPFRLGGSTGFVTAAFDAARDIPFESEWTTGPQDATLLVSGGQVSAGLMSGGLAPGVRLHRAELRGLWNWSVWLESSPDSHDLEAADARRRASALVDNGDPEHPRRIFADSC